MLKDVVFRFFYPPSKLEKRNQAFSFFRRENLTAEPQTLRHVVKFCKHMQMK